MEERRYTQSQINLETNRFFQKVYLWMFFGLLISGVTSYYVSLSENLINLFIFNKGLFYSLLFLEILLVLFLVFLIKKIHSYLAVFAFLFYSFVTGLTLSIIFLIYTIDSIINVFFITSGMFLAMSIYGFTTTKDLTGMGQILIMGLFGLIIASITNLFFKNSILDFILSIFGVIIFTGLTAYDTQKIKKNNILGNEGTDEDKKEAIMGALTLYLDFINLFLKLLRLFGKRK